MVSVNETDKMVKSLREFRQKEWLAKRRAFLTSRQKLGLDHLDPMGEQEEEFPQELDYSSIGTQDDYVEHHCQYTRYDVSNDPCPQGTTHHTRVYTSLTRYNPDYCNCFNLCVLYCDW